MNLYLALHAEVEDKTSPELDAGRKIVQQGFDDIDRIGGFAPVAKDGTLSAIYHSHTVRTRETAQGFAEHFKPRDGAVEIDGLMADDDISGWLERLNAADDDIMIVGHMPNLKRIAGSLVAGDEAAHPIQFARAGVACLNRRDDNSWAVSWMVTPALV
jgi:phosphohistidine phosphatase